MTTQYAADADRVAEANCATGTWAFANGAKLAQELEYIPLPAAVQETIRAAWKAEVKFDGKPVWTT